MARETMLVLASSRKLGGRCVAGLGLDSGRLVRPVSPTDDGTLSLADCAVDGEWPSLLQVVEFGRRRQDARPWQPENLVVDGSPWTSGTALSARRLDEVLRPCLHVGSTLLGNRGAAIPAEDCEHGVDGSLALIETSDLRFEHERVSWGRGSRPRAWFRHGGRQWRLPLTDFVIRPRLLRRSFGIHTWDDLGLTPPRRTVLTISLGEPHQGWHYKLVAAVMRMR